MSVFSLFLFVVFLAICGFVLWGINRLVPMASPIKTLLNAVVVIVLFIISGFWIMDGFGLWGLIHTSFTQTHHYRH